MAKKETCGWQNTDLTKLTRWHRHGLKRNDWSTNNVMFEFSWERYEKDQTRAIWNDCVNA